MTHSTNQNVDNKGELDLRPKDPWISGTLNTKRSSPFQNKNLLNANGVIKILRYLYGAQSSGWERENRQDFNMTTLQTVDKSLGVIPVKILIHVSNFFESE